MRTLPSWLGTSGRRAALLALVLTLGCGAVAVEPERTMPGLALSIPVAPTVATFETERALVFELMIRNDGSGPLLLEEVTLSASPYAWTPPENLCDALQRYPEIDAEDLPDLGPVRERMREDAALAPCSIPAGRTAFVAFWARAGRDEAVSEAGFEAGFEAGSEAGPEVPLTVEVRLRRGEAVERGSVETRALRAPELVLGPPLRGGTWLVSNGLSSDAGHRSMALQMRGAPHWAQRFAADLSALDESGCVIPSDATFAENARYVGYGHDVVAVADGRIARVVEGIPENVPGAASHAVAITASTVTGNAVWLELGEDRFAFYAHLIPGSIVVREGQHVARGELLGRLGNSGNATSPHLHFHVARGLGGLETEGLPYVFERFAVQRVAVPDGLFETERCVAIGAWHTLERTLPSNDSLIRFEP
jgi:hypothetical protein